MKKEDQGFWEQVHYEAVENPIDEADDYQANHWLSRVKYRKLRYFGLVMRQPPNSIENGGDDGAVMYR